MFADLVRKNRSYRRFDESVKITKDELVQFIDLARITPSAMNLQPLKYIVSYDEKRNSDVFSTLSWAGYLKDWDGPSKGERPTGYIIMLLDKSYAKEIAKTDIGIAAQTITLAAVEHGFGGCMIGAVNRDKLRKLLKIDNNYEIALVIAIGKPAEEIMLLEAEQGSIEYFRDERDVHCVPKRRLKDILIN